MGNRVLVERASFERGTVCRVTLNRPDRLNALDDSTRQELEDAFVVLRDDPDTRVMVLQGAGRAFSAGADLADAAPSVTTAPASPWLARRHAAALWPRLLDLLEALPQVTVARLQGHVIGGAALLASACDVRVAGTDVEVAIPEVALGLPLTWAGLPRLVREVGLPLTRDLVMTGRRLSGEAVLSSGFVQRLVPLEDLDAAVDELVTALLAQPAGPLAMTKAALSAIGRNHPATTGAWSDPDLLAWSLRDPESRAAAAAYLAGRLGGGRP